MNWTEVITDRPVTNFRGVSIPWVTTKPSSKLDVSQPSQIFGGPVTEHNRVGAPDVSVSMTQGHATSNWVTSAEGSSYCFPATRNADEATLGPTPMQVFDPLLSRPIPTSIMAPYRSNITRNGVIPGGSIGHGMCNCNVIRQRSVHQVPSEPRQGFSAPRDPRKPETYFVSSSTRRASGILTTAPQLQAESLGSTKIGRTYTRQESLPAQRRSGRPNVGENLISLSKDSRFSAPLTNNVGDHAWRPATSVGSRPATIAQARRASSLRRSSVHCAREQTVVPRQINNFSSCHQTSGPCASHPPIPHRTVSPAGITRKVQAGWEAVQQQHNETYQDWPSKHSQQQSRYYPARESILSERVVEHEVRIPKKVLRENVVERVIVVPETVLQEEVVEDLAIVREKVVEVAKPVVQESIVEVPEIEYVEKIVEVPEVVVQEQIREVPRIEVQERVIEVPKVVTHERVVEVPTIQYVEVLYEKVVEVPEVVEHVRFKHTPVVQIMERPTPEFVKVEVEQVVPRSLPVPVEAVSTISLKLPRIRARHTQLNVPLFVPRFIEIAVPAEMLDATATEAYAQQVEQVFSRTSASLGEIEEVACILRERNEEYAAAAAATGSGDIEGSGDNAFLRNAWCAGRLSLGNASAIPVIKMKKESSAASAERNICTASEKLPEDSCRDGPLDSGAQLGLAPEPSVVVHKENCDADGPEPEVEEIREKRGNEESESDSSGRINVMPRSGCHLTNKVGMELRQDVEGHSCESIGDPSQRICAVPTSPFAGLIAAAGAAVATVLSDFGDIGIGSNNGTVEATVQKQSDLFSAARVTSKDKRGLEPENEANGFPQGSPNASDASGFLIRSRSQNDSLGSSSYIDDDANGAPRDLSNEEQARGKQMNLISDHRNSLPSTQSSTSSTGPTPCSVVEAAVEPRAGIWTPDKDVVELESCTNSSSLESLQHETEVNRQRTAPGWTTHMTESRAVAGVPAQSSVPDDMFDSEDQITGANKNCNGEYAGVASSQGSILMPVRTEAPDQTHIT